MEQKGIGFFFKLRYFQIIKVNNVISKINWGNNKRETDDNGSDQHMDLVGHYWKLFSFQIKNIWNPSLS